jgi:hypothetical protein
LQSFILSVCRPSRVVFSAGNPAACPPGEVYEVMRNPAASNSLSLAALHQHTLSPERRASPPGEVRQECAAKEWWWLCSQGLTPLLAALSASSPGVSVVNIDNGFGAGMLAARILRTAAKLRAQAVATASSV